MRKIFLFAIMALICSGCASYVNYLFDSDPEGAKIYCFDGTYYLGTTPFYMHETKEKADKHRTSDGDIVWTPCEAVWPSGARAQLPLTAGVRANDGRVPNVAIFHVQRPKDYPNLELDYQLGLKNKQLDIQQQQVVIQQQQIDESKRPRTTNCQTDFLGNVTCKSW